MYATTQSAGQSLPASYTSAQTVFGPLADALASFVIFVRTTIVQYKQQRLLASLDDRTLADIGIPRSEIPFVSQRVANGEPWRGF